MEAGPRGLPVCGGGHGDTAYTGRLALISAHAHDCDGARRTCLRAGQVNRVGIRELSFLQPADAEATDLPGVVRQLLAQEASRYRAVAMTLGQIPVYTRL